MKKTLFMHIGFPKTGTTTIQKWCYDNKLLLLNNGIYYPKTLPALCQHYHISPSVKAYSPYFDSDNQLSNMISELKNCTCNTIVLSSEFFLYDNADIYNEIFTLFDEIRIILYIRDIFSYSESALQQDIQTPEAKQVSPEQAIRLHPATLGRWINKFGAQGCIIKNFNTIAQNGNLLDNFLSTIGVHGTSINTAMSSNKSLKTPYVFFLRHLANLPIKYSYWIQYVNAIRDLSDNDSDAQTYTIIPKQIWDSNIERIKSQISYEAELLHDPTWHTLCLDKYNKLIFCPYKQLPANEQHRIFTMLPKHLQDIIIQYFPYSDKKKTNTDLLPPIFYDELVNNTIFIWRKTLFKELASQSLKSQNADI